MDDEPDIEYEALPVVTELSGNEQQADAGAFDGACALLRLYTSQTYLAESAALFGRLCDVFERWPQARQRLGESTLSEWTAALREQRAAFERGMALLEAGYTAAAYASIAEATNDGLEPRDPRDDRHFSLRYAAEEIGAPLSDIAARLGPMASRISATLSAQWSYQTLISDPPPQENEAPVAFEENLAVDTDALVPKTGLWVPTTIRYGCPNFLIAGQAAAPMTRAGTRYDYAASDGGGIEPPRDAWSAYDYIEEPTVWRMVWYDTRYRAGAQGK